MKLAEKSLERYASRLYAARGTGGYRAAAFVFARSGDAEIIARATKGVLSGAHTADRPFHAFPVGGPASDLFRSRVPAVAVLNEAAPILGLDQACQMLLLPEAELPGLQLRRSVFLGRNTRPPQSDVDPVHLGPDAFWRGSTPRRTVQVEYGDLMRHMLIAGATGSGKTWRAVEILNGLEERDDLQIVVFETAKGVYRNRLQRANRPPPRVYTIGDGRESTGRFRPLRLNPFQCDLFEQQVDGATVERAALKRHIVVLADALTDLMPTEALIGPKLREAVESCYRDLGWDIERGEWLGEGAPLFPDGMDFVVAVRRIAAALNYGPEVNANYRGALEGRAQLFLQDSYRDLFVPTGEQTLDALLPRDTDVIFESESLPAGEINIPAFLLSILLSRLRERALRVRRKAGSGDLDEHRLLVIEEAHNVLAREHEQQGDARQSQGERTLLKRFTKLLAEGRELGLGVLVVEQSPSMLARSVIANTGTKVVMRLEDGAEIEEMGQSLGLEEASWSDLGLLRRGEAIIKASFMTHPVKSSPYETDELSPGVAKENTAEDRGRAASYRRLAALWREHLREGEPPNGAWRKRLISAACGDPGIAAASASLALLEEDEDRHLDARAVAREALRRARSFDSVIDAMAPIALRLQVAARSDALWALTRRLLAVAWGAPACPPLSGLDVVGFVAESVAGDAGLEDNIFELLQPATDAERALFLDRLGLPSDEALAVGLLALSGKPLVLALLEAARDGASPGALKARSRRIVELVAQGLFDAPPADRIDQLTRRLCRQARHEAGWVEGGADA